VPEPGQRAADFAAFIDGLLFDQIAGASDRDLTASGVRAAIGTLIAGVAGGPLGAGVRAVRGDQG
jgi:hypothetical protein